MDIPESAARFLSRQVERVKQLKPKRRIVFPEGDDPRVIAAAERLAQEDLVVPILVGKGSQACGSGLTCVHPDSSPRLREYSRLLHERRRARGMTQMEADSIARRPLYFASLMVAAGDADGFVGGAANTTAETMRAVLQTIGTAPKVKIVSSSYFMALRNRKFGCDGIVVFADCAVVPDPAPVQLADIAIATTQTARMLFECEPCVALLSFSTKGSGKSKQADKVVETLRIVRERAPDLHVDGELQADAAVVESVGRSKAPGSTVAGRANVLIFPDLNSANIGYKLVERLGEALAIGPFLSGLAKPANDLSRGAPVETIYQVGIVTALQAAAQP